MTPTEVRKALKARGLTQRDIAKICGVSEASVSMVVTGKIYSATIWAAILRLLGRSPRKGAK
jgi:transcriptional regulator with XRE-family HTH domain